jgi:ABC-type transport system involved in cytochrome c biogenesis permease component
MSTTTPTTVADTLRPLTAQTGAEIHMTLRRGETLLLTLGIPVIFLLFFSKVSVVATPTATPANFFVPGILSLAVMSTAMVSLGIATGFERGYGVLKRLGATPLGRPRLLGAKIITIVAVELLQAAILLPVGLALGWNPGGGGAVAVAGAIGAVLLGSAAPACSAPRSSPLSPSSSCRRPSCSRSDWRWAGTPVAVVRWRWPAPSAPCCWARPPSPGSAC